MVSAPGAVVELQESFRNVNVLGSLISDFISGLTTIVGAGEVGTAELADGAVTAVKQGFAGTGSPPAGGRMVQGGEDVLADGSLWVAYPTPFTAAPHTVVTPLIEEANWDVKYRVSAGSQDTGSFLAMGSHATGSFTWIAIGSGEF